MDDFSDGYVQCSCLFIDLFLNVVRIDNYYNLLKEHALKEFAFVEGMELIVVVEGNLGYLVGGALWEICKLAGIGRVNRRGVGDKCICSWCGDKSEVSVLTTAKGGCD